MTPSTLVMEYGPVPIGCRRISRGLTWQGYIGASPEASKARIAGCGASGKVYAFSFVFNGYHVGVYAIYQLQDSMLKEIITHG